MKTLRTFWNLGRATAAGLLLAACTQLVAGQEEVPAILPLVQPINYVCPDGHLITLDHDRTAGILRGVRGGEVFTLQEQVGRTPPRFVTGSDSVDLDREVANLRRGQSERQACNRVPAEPVEGKVWGTITKPDRMALPTGTRAKVLLVDTARADAPAVELGSMALVTTGNQVPLHFLISYDPARTAGPARPVLQARITSAEGQLLYITDSVNPIPNGAPPPSPIELRLVRTGASTP